MTVYYKALTDRLFLVQQTVDKVKRPILAKARNHIAVIDCSGSMAGDLPEIRAQLKRRLTSILNEGDTLTVIWFSGRGECGVLIECEEIAGLKELQDVHQRIDRWLRPVGMTGFKEPLELAAFIANALTKKNNAPIALFFMTDGQDNQWPRAVVLDVIDEAFRSRIAAATFVEYGPYADRRMIAAMAQAAGGRHILADDFNAYAPIFEQSITAQILGTPRVEIKLGQTPVERLVFAVRGDDLSTYETTGASGRSTLVDADVDQVFYLADEQPKSGASGADTSMAAEAGLQCAAYAALALLATRMRPDLIKPLLRFTGDIRLIDMSATCFDKQAYARFAAEAQRAAIDPRRRLKDGYDPNRIPRDDAFTLLHLLEMLQSDESTRVCLDHPAFEYSRISRQHVDAEGALKFTPDPAPDGYPISGLVFHEDQPNVSIRIKKTGSVDLTPHVENMPDDVYKILSKDRWAVLDFPTHIWRTYAIVAHGIGHVKRLPVKISPQMLLRLTAQGMRMEVAEGGVTVIDLEGVPMLNQQMIQSVSMRDAIDLEYQLARARAYQKVFKHAVDERGLGDKTAKLAEKYGDAAAAWLAEHGITDGGFSPKTNAAPASDVITGRELAIKLAKYSTLPPVAAVGKKVASKAKLNGPESLMAEALAEIEETSAKICAKETGPDRLASAKEKIDAWISARARSLITETRALLVRAARMKWPITVGQAWFREFKTLDETSLDVTLNGQTFSGRAELREIEIQI